MPPPFQGEDSLSIVSNLWWNKNQAFFSYQFPFSSLDLECFILCVTLFLGELSSLQIDHSSIFFLLWVGLYALLFLWSWLLIGFVKHSEKTSWMGASVFMPTTTKSYARVRIWLNFLRLELDAYSCIYFAGIITSLRASLVDN